MKATLARATLLAMVAWLAQAAWAAPESIEKESDKPMTDAKPTQTEFTQLATFATGCFWCTEAVFARVKGVKSVKSGYTGGPLENPTYKQVCTGATGHAEAVQIVFDPAVVSYAELLDVFWSAHDPTTLNRQGADAGTQYRSAIFHHSEEQKATAAASKARQNASGHFKNPIVTEITAATTFYAAEDYHQDYFDNNRTAPYCRMMIAPKLEKLGMKE